MAKVVFLFPGQGSQGVGMGKLFYDAYSSAREVFQHGDELLSCRLSSKLFEGPEEELQQTINSQPAIYVTSMAILAVLREQFPRLKADLCAGHSLGEYSALTAGGWLSFDLTLPLVQFRAQAMSDQCRSYPGAMAAILGLEEEAIRKVVSQVKEGLWAANFNCPGQIVISGTVEGIQKGMELAKAAGAKRALLLPVQGAFHSGLMKRAEELVGERLDHIPFAKEGTPIISNTTGEIAHSAEAIKAALRPQITSSVLWTKTIEQVADATLFIEIGNGKVLAGLNKKIGVTVPTISINQPSDLEALAEVLS